MSRTAIGWILLCTHLGVVMTGRRLVRWRTISNDADPEPMMTPACRIIVSTPDAIRIRPTSVRECRCRDSWAPSGCRPPR